MPYLAMEFRHGLRQIRKSPGFFSLAALLVAMGIASTTLIFALVNAVLLRPLSVRDPQNLVQLMEQQPKRPADPYFDYSFYRRLRDASSTLFDIAGQVDTAHALQRKQDMERVHAVGVTESFFSALGIDPLLGRVLGKNDDHVAVLSFACWSRDFARDPKVLGQAVRLDGHVYTIVGVTPERFTGTTADSSPDLWVPFANELDFSRTPNPHLDHYVIEIIARLRSGVSPRQAQEETAALWTRSRKEAGLSDASPSRGLKVGRLEVQSIAYGVSTIRGQSKTALLWLLAGTGFLLLMVCANVGGLLLSRAMGKEPETALRIALGASAAQTLGPLLMEGLLLTMIGGGAGLLLAYAGMPMLMRWMPPAHGIGFDPSEIRALALRPALDWRVAGFSLAMCVTTLVLSALTPVLNSLRFDINLALKRTTGDRSSRRYQSFLCALQIVVCTALLISAGLMIRSLWSLRVSDVGFDRDHITEFSIDPRVPGYDSQKIWSLENRVLHGARNLPDVEDAALAYRALMRGIGLGTSVVFPGEGGDGIVNTSLNSITPEYFSVMRIRFLMGRNFGPPDQAGANKTERVVVNEAFVRKFLHGRNTLGETFDTGQRFVQPQFQIVGVVSDTKYRSLREVPPPIFYTRGFGPKSYPDTFILHVRTHANPHSIIEPMRKLLRSIDPQMLLFQVSTVAEEVNRSLWQERLLAALTTCFGLFALVLSALGVYGILAYFVIRQQREIGVRLALGARSRDVIWLIAGRVFPIIGIGAIGGIALSWTAGGWLRGLLYEVNAFDPSANLSAILLLITIGVAAAALPALRALRVDPVLSLRQE